MIKDYFTVSHFPCKKTKTKKKKSNQISCLHIVSALCSKLVADRQTDFHSKCLPRFLNCYFYSLIASSLFLLVALQAAKHPIGQNRRSQRGGAGTIRYIHWYIHISESRSPPSRAIRDTTRRRPQYRTAAVYGLSEQALLFLQSVCDLTRVTSPRPTTDDKNK